MLKFVVFLLKKYNLRCKRNIIFCWRNITLVEEKITRKVPPVLGGVKYYSSVWGNTISVVGEMLKKPCIGRKVQFKKRQKECWRNAEKMQKEKRENAKRMLEKRRENFPPVLGSAKRGANSLGAVSTSADQHNQWSSNQCFFLLAIIKTNTFYNLDKYFLHFRQIYFAF